MRIELCWQWIRTKKNTLSVTRILLLTGHGSHKTPWQRTEGKRRHKTHKVMGNRWDQLQPGRKSQTHHNKTGNGWPNSFAAARRVTLCVAGTLSIYDPPKWTIPETLQRPEERNKTGTLVLTSSVQTKTSSVINSELLRSANGKSSAVISRSQTTSSTKHKHATDTHNPEDSTREDVGASR